MTTNHRPLTTDHKELPASGSDRSVVGRPSPAVDEQLLDTQRAFDSVAADYDGPRGNNVLIQRMRETVWRLLEHTFAPGARLLDLGCGTGLDAVHLAQRGYQVVASDWSPQMVERTRARAAAANLENRVTVAHVGIHELNKLQAGSFAGMYSNF